MGIGALKIQKRGSKDQTSPTAGIDVAHPLIGNLVDPVTPAGLTDSNFYGVVGGSVNTTQPAAYPNTVGTLPGSGGYPVILVLANVGSGAVNARIVAQKGSGKFLVTTTSSPTTAQCVLVNTTNGTLNPGEMSIVINNGTTNVALKRLTNKYGIGFDGNRYFLNFFAASVPSTTSLATTSWSGNGTTVTFSFSAQASAPFAVGSTVTVSGYGFVWQLNGNWVVQSCTTSSVTVFCTVTMIGPEEIGSVSQSSAATVLKSGAVASTWTANAIGAIPMVLTPKQP